MTGARVLPPGQIETGRFPVVGEREPSPELSDPAAWWMEITGLVERPIRLGLESFLGMADRSFDSDIHCVTGWSRFGVTWTGLPLAALLDQAGVDPAARYVSFVAFSGRGHHTSLPLEVAHAASWLVHSFQGEPLTVEHGGPVRVVTPGRYFYKSLKWLQRVELLGEDRLGWWEEHSGYHNNADPWTGTERFTTGSLRPGQLSRFLEAADYAKYRGRVMLGLDLRGWRPRTRDLRRLHLKNCDLRRIDLTGADLRESNLSLSDLRGARLQGADLSGSDLEGANFAGADLTGADLSNTALTATRFRDQSGGADLTGARFEGCRGLVEEQEEYVLRFA